MALGPQGDRSAEQVPGEGIVLDRRVVLESVAVTAGIAREDRLGAEASGEHRGKDPLGSEWMGEAKRIPDEERTVAVTRFEVSRIEEGVRVALHVRERLAGALRDVTLVEKEPARGGPGRARLPRHGGAAPHVQPASLGHVPRVAGEVIVEEELGLTVRPDSRGGNLLRTDLQLSLLRGDWPAGPGGSELSPDGAVGASCANDPARAMHPIDGPDPVLALERGHRVALDERGPAAAE